MHKQPHYFLDQGWLFPTSALRTNASINQDGCAKGRHVCLPKTPSTTVTDKLHYLCLSAPNVWQTRHKMNSSNCPTEVLKYSRIRPWYSLNSSKGTSNFLPLSLLWRRGLSRNRPLYFSWKEWWGQDLDDRSPFFLCPVKTLLQICFPPSWPT